MPLSKSYRTLPVIVVAIVAAILAIVQIVPEKPLLLAERLFHYGGWVQITIISAYSGLLAYNMQFTQRRGDWRVYSWLLFTIVFYSQLILGITADSMFLLTGKLHLPIPAIIIAGPLYRFSSWFMIILFFSTVIMTGPAWCSHLCYFGAIEATAVKDKKRSGRPKRRVRVIMLGGIISVALLLRILNAKDETAILLASIFIIAALLLIFLVSRVKGNMYHCTHFCPVGILVSNIKYISPFRFRINGNCTKCNSCIASCRYFALDKEGIAVGKIYKNCTYCGDCIKACKHNAFEYRFLNLSPVHAEKLWIIITVSVHAIFLSIARI